MGQTEASKVGLAMSGLRPIADLSWRGGIGRKMPDLDLSSALGAISAAGDLPAVPVRIALAQPSHPLESRCLSEPPVASPTL